MEDNKKTPAEVDAHTPAECRDTGVGLPVVARDGETPGKPEQSEIAAAESYCQLLPVFFKCEEEKNNNNILQKTKKN